MGTLNKTKKWLIINTKGEIVDRFYRMGTALMWISYYNELNGDIHTIKMEKEINGVQ